MNQALLNLLNVLGDLTDLNKKKNGLSYWFTTILYLRPIFIIIQKWVDFFSPSVFCFFSTCKIDIRSFFLILRHFKHVWCIDLKVFLRNVYKSWLLAIITDVIFLCESIQKIVLINYFPEEKNTIHKYLFDR